MKWKNFSERNLGKPTNGSSAKRDNHPLESVAFGQNFSA